MSVGLLTAEVEARIAARIELGVSLVDAAVAAGVKAETAKSWLARGRREDDGRYAAFAAAVEQARERAAERPEVVDDRELARIVSELARAGSVQAAKLRYDMLRAERADGDGGERPSDPLDEIDELARRRMGGGA